MRFTAHPATSAGQFRCEVLGAIAELVATLPPASAAALGEAIPTLADYCAAAADCWQGAAEATPAEWREVLAAIGARHPEWPLQRLALLAPSPLPLRLLVILAMVEEDPALSLFFDPEPGAPTLGGLVSRLRGFAGQDAPDAVRAALSQLIDTGFVDVVAPGGARAERRYKAREPIVEMVCGAPPRMSGTRFTPAADLSDPADWIAPAPGTPLPQDAAGHLRQTGGVLVIRGAAHNGRKSFAAMAARSASLGVLECGSASLADENAYRAAIAVATLAGAALLVEPELAPSETLKLPSHAAAPIPLILVCARHGAVGHIGQVPLRTIRLPMPDPAARRTHWRQSGAGGRAAALGLDWTLTSGNIRRAAAVAAPALAVATDDASAREAVRMALRDLRDARLEALATPVDDEIPPAAVFLDREAQEEVDLLVARCRHREALSGPVGTAGVKALLSGPSGVGKTLAARHVALRLGRDLFRIDLAATVNKYIGETEKALERALAAAEELDIVILLDEGDALMARRTDVGNANDRYANLETNFLLQRIESFAGILLVTSNDAERIDPAFARRMDAAIVLRAPDQLRREAILAAHLGDDAAGIAPLIRDIACRCVLTGGQIRNVALHARLLALEGVGRVGANELRAAILREYRKLGSPCPLRGAGRDARALAMVG
ncbi:MAG: ATP-binding protein [Novosphingobium sp.]